VNVHALYQEPRALVCVHNVAERALDRVVEHARENDSAHIQRC
jgi:hypothetical protein